MVAIERHDDHLKQIAEAGWKAPQEHPDLDPAHEALQLREHFAELQRLDDVKTKPERFRQYLQVSEAAAKDLERALRDVAPIQKAQPAWAAINAACTSCHQEYRDVPLAEKR